jgi:hypothetical protein
MVSHNNPRYLFILMAALFGATTAIGHKRPVGSRAPTKFAKKGE